MRFTDTEGSTYETVEALSGRILGRITWTDRPGVAVGDVVKTGDPTTVAREADLLRRLGGEGVPSLRHTGRVSDGPAQGSAFLIMEHVGRDLGTVLREVHNLQRDRPAQDEVDRIALDLLDVLCVFEARGLEATWLRPEHVLLSEDPRCCVRVCGLTGGELPPTVPEQFPVAGRTQLFLWGRTMQAVLGTGATSGNPQGLHSAVSQCTQPDPAARPDSARAVRDMVTGPATPMPVAPVIDVRTPPAEPGLVERAGHAIVLSEKPGLTPDLRMGLLVIAMFVGMVLGVTASGLLLGR